MTMRKISLFAALVVAMGAVSCVQDINDGTPVNNDGAKTFEATFDAAASKAVLKPGADESKVEWEAGDQVSVLAGEGNYLYTAASPGASTTLNTEATDVPSEGTFYAVYPYDNAAALADGKISTTLPAEQTAVLGSFSTHLAVAQTTGSTLAFKNVCGLVKVTVSDAEVTKVEFKGNTNEIVAGGVSVTVTDTPAWTATETGSQVVTLVSAGEAATLAKGVYYLAVLPQTFEGGITVTAYKGDEAWDVRKVETRVTVERSDIKGSNSFGVEGSGTEADPYILDAAQDLVEMRNLATLGGETWFKMVKDIDMKGITDYIPVNYDQNFERKIHFDGGNFTISNFKYDKSVNGANYGSLFGVLYGSCRNLKVDKAEVVATNGCGVIGGYVGTTGKPAVLENVTITNSSVTNAGDRCGGVCGTAKEATIKNVSFQGTVTSTFSGEAKSGGFVGQTETSATFENCSADVVFTGKGTDIGGFAGKLLNTNSFKNCKVKVTITSSAAQKNRCGGFVGWNSSASATFEDCHVLSGSSVKNVSGGTASVNGNFGGFIGYGDTNNSVVEIKNCSAQADVDGGVTAYNSCFVSIFGYQSTVTITNCYAKGNLKSSTGNFTGGLVGYAQNASTVLKLSGCHYEGSLEATGGYVGGRIGGIASKAEIKTSYSTGTVVSKGAYVGGLVGASQNDNVVIADCFSTAKVSAWGQQVGGLVGTTTNKLTMSNCYASGDVYSATSGAAGLVGRVAKSSIITNCIAWNKNISTSRTANNVYAPGGVLGCAQEAGTYSGCIRRYDMDLVDEWISLYDQPDYINAMPPLPSYSTATHQQAYHGKAAAAGATIASVAQSLGWDSNIWNFAAADSAFGFTIKVLGDNKIEF